MISATHHDRFVGQDYDRLLPFGIRTVREGVRWPLVEAEPDGPLDFSTVLTFLREARSRGIEIIWDMLHFGWPDHLDVFGEQWVDSFERFVREFCQVIKRETAEPPFIAPVNEISFLSWAGGEVAYMNPFARDRGAQLKTQLVRAFIRSTKIIRRIIPEAMIVSPEPVIHIAGRDDIPGDAGQAEAFRLSMFEAWDMVLGRDRADLGGSEGNIDVIGVNYYDRNQWWNFGETIRLGQASYRPFHKILIEVYKRYQRPLFVSETGIEDGQRPQWFAYICDEVRTAIAQGVPLAGICLYPILNHPGWDDERHCHNGLFDYASDTGSRDVYQPLADEILRQELVRLEGGTQ